MTDQQPGAPDGPGNSGHWRPVPGGGDYDPDQTMHVSFAAQLPPEPRPGEDPLGAHGPAGPQPPGGYQEQPGDGGEGAEGDPATSWTIPVIRDDAEADSGEYSVGAFAPSWDEAPSPAPTQSFPVGMFGQGAAAAAQARAAARAAAESGGHSTGQWEMPFGGPEAGGAVPWLPAHAPAADAAWSGVVDDPERTDEPGAAPYGHPGDASGDTAQGPGGYGTSSQALDRDYGSADEPGHTAAGRTGHVSGPDRGGRLGSGPPDGEDRPAGHGSGAGSGDVSASGAQAYDSGPHDGAEPYTGDGALPDGADEGAESADGDPSDADGTHGTDGSDGSDGERDPEAGSDQELGSEEFGSAEFGPDQEFGSAFADDASFTTDPEPEPEPVEETRSDHPLASYMLRVNGTDRPVTDAWLGESLLYVLRERLGLAGAKDGCEEGECGACSVKVDGRLVASCLVPAATAAGSEVRTVEGLTVDGRPSDVQRALADCGAVQCGFCIPGMAMTVHDLLEGNHKPSELQVRQALSGNLCRCSGYRGVLDAVQRVVAERETAADDDSAPDGRARVPHQGGPAGDGGSAENGSAGPAGGAL